MGDAPWPQNVVPVILDKLLNFTQLKKANQVCFSWSLRCWLLEGYKVLPISNISQSIFRVAVDLTLVLLDLLVRKLH